MKSGATGRSDVVVVDSGGGVVVVESSSVAVVAVGGNVVGVVFGDGAVVILVSPLGEQATRARANAAVIRVGCRTRETVGMPAFKQGKSGLVTGSGSFFVQSLLVPNATLYFAYGSLLDPDKIEVAAPGSRFLFTAHYPETKLDFVASDEDGAIPTLTKQSGHTVWGGVFEIPEDQVDSLTHAEKVQGREPGFDHRAVDREGNKHHCLTFVATGDANGDHRPNADYLEAMIKGARHWSLPAGWVLGLEDLSDDPLFF